MSDDSLRNGLSEKIRELEEKLSHFRAALHALGGNGTDHPEPRAAVEVPKMSVRPTSASTVSYAGMGARQAVLHYYRLHGSAWATAPEIHEELVRYGWTSSSSDPLNIIRATLKRLHTDDKTFEKRPFGLNVQYRPIPNHNLQLVGGEELTGMN